MFRDVPSTMINAATIAIILVALVTLVTAGDDFVTCSEPEHHLKQCDFGGICAWDGYKCREGGKGCTLVCQKKMKYWCNGQSEGDRCIASHPQYECMKCGRKLMCLRNPRGPVCSNGRHLYYQGEIVIPPSTCGCDEIADGVGKLRCG